MEQSKTCTQCGECLPLSEYSPEKRWPGLYRSECKACLRRRALARRAARSQETRARDRASDREYQRRRYAERREEILERRRQRYLLDSGPELTGKREEYVRLNVRWRARQDVRRALRAGTLERESCLFCDDPNTQAHHHSYAPEDSLNVTWLCTKHHGLVHRQVDEPV